LGESSYRLGACSLAIAVALVGSEAARAAEPLASWGKAPASTDAASQTGGQPTPVAPSSPQNNGQPAATAAPSGTPAPAPKSPTGGDLPAAAPAATLATAQPPAAAENIRLNTTGRTMSIVVSVKEGAATLGDADAQIQADDTILVSLSQVVRLMSPRLNPATLGKLNQVDSVAGFATLAAFEKQGFAVRFDKRAFELDITLATADRAVQTIGLADLDRSVIGDFATPSSFSAYVNIRGSLDYLIAGSDKGFNDPSLLFDGAMRIAPFVLEAEGSWNDHEFTRTGTRLVFDDVKHLLRWTAGDLQPETRGFQGAVDIAGISIARSYALLEPQRNVAPRGGRTFSLTREATVEAYINGRPIRTIRLAPGTYNVGDFPFAQGGNDVDLVIVDDTGQRETISFSTYIQRTQLAAGLSEFDFNVGVVSRPGQGISYTGDPAVTGYYRRGLSDNLTMGANFQYAQKSYMGGFEAVLGTGIGTLGGDVAYSHVSGVGSGYAANFSLERITQNVKGSASLLVTVELRSRRFGAVEQLTPDNPYDYNASVSYSRSLGPRSFAGVQARYAHGRDGNVDERSARVNYGLRFGKSTSLTFDLEWDKGVRGDDKSFSVSLVRRFGQRSSAQAEYDSRDQAVRLGFQSSGGYGVGSWNAGGNLDIGREDVALNAAANYIANRADLGLAYTATYSQDSKRITDQRASLRFATSLAFADGSFAIGRPINDSFAIVRPYKAGRGIDIVVEPAQNSGQAKSGIFGPALYGEITSYSPRTLTYDVPDAPAGLDLGTGALRTLAPYHSGYVVVVGSDYNVMAVGTLKVKGDVLSLQAGSAVEEGGEHRRVELFTNREGRFAIAGLKPGKWRIEIAGTPPIVYDLLVPKDATGVVRVGDLAPTDER
jgi:outer membrane usher protein